MQSKPEPATLPNEAVKDHWDHFAPLYTTFDATMQTFYYSIVNMLKLSTAEHIL
jgi:hypothetical protein